MSESKDDRANRMSSRVTGGFAGDIIAKTTERHNGIAVEVGESPKTPFTIQMGDDLPEIFVPDGRISPGCLILDSKAIVIAIVTNYDDNLQELGVRVIRKEDYRPGNDLFSVNPESIKPDKCLRLWDYDAVPLHERG